MFKVSRRRPPGNQEEPFDMTTVFSTWGAGVTGSGAPLPQELPIRALMGWGGLIINDNSVDIVDMTREFAARFRAESCGQCYPCRMGSEELAATLERICDGRGKDADIVRIEDLAEYVHESARCDIGITSPHAILDAIRNYCDRFIKAVKEGKPIPRGEYVSQVTAPCMSACPDRLDIPNYVEKIRMDQWDEAIEVVRRTCCMPGTIGRVCVRDCEFRCKRGSIDEPIAIKHLKRYAHDQELACGGIPDVTAPAKDARVAIIGAGPAGLSCAYYLGLAGYRSTIFEALSEPGGMAAFGIPDYRLPREIIRSEVRRVEAVGAEIRYNVKVGVDVTINDLLEKEGYKAVFIGAGAPNSSGMCCEGEDAGYSGYMPGVEFLRRVALGEKPLTGKKILVIGGGNVAMDCVRTARRLGFTDVNLLYRRTEKEMPADRVEIAESKEEGVTFHTLTAPILIIAEGGKVTGLECMRMTLGAPDASGRRKPVPQVDTSFIMDCDAIVPAIGQTCEVDTLAPEGVNVTKWRTLIANPITMQTSVPNIFGGGDCVTGPSSLVSALAAGRKAASSIARYLETGGCAAEGADWLDLAVSALSKGGHADDAPFAVLTHRIHPPVADPQKRVNDFSEVEGGLSTAQARKEAGRCLRCYRIALASLR
jgi:formate dehydrogenase beta subunit